MKCTICGTWLANSNEGRHAHMKRYHATTTIKSVAPIHPPMTPEEKKAAIARFEAKNTSHVFGGKVEIISDSQSKQEVFIEKPATTEQRTLEMVNRRLDDLIVRSDAVLKQMKVQFGD